MVELEVAYTNGIVGVLVPIANFLKQTGENILCNTRNI